MMAASASRPSVNAAGPGCRMSGDLISRTKLSRTAGTSAKPGRAATLAGANFLPHQEPTMMSGLAAINLSADTMRSLAFLRADSAGNTSTPPAISMSSATQRMPEIIGSAHLFEKDGGPRPERAAAAPGRAHPRLRQPPLQRLRERIGLAGRADQRAEGADHVENAGDVTLVEGMHRDVAADQLGGDVGLQVGEGENEVGLEREDFFKVGGDERRHPRLLPAHPRRPHRVA